MPHAIRIRTAAIVMLGAAALAGCGGGAGVATRSATIPVASGPIASACLSAARRSASRTRCGCIQAAANRSLSGGDQRRGAAFFAEPHRAQETRQSDRPRDEAFWTRWKAFSNGAERLCRAT